MPGGILAESALKMWAEELKKDLKPSILAKMFKLGEVIYKTSRFTVRITPASKIGIYDKKNNIEWALWDVKENPKNFTRALVKRVPFFELYEKIK